MNCQRFSTTQGLYGTPFLKSIRRIGRDADYVSKAVTAQLRRGSCGFNEDRQMKDITVPEPTITVVINTYNDRVHIGKAIQSVLDQTVPAHEIIVVDDGSSDGTEDYLRKNFGDKLIYHYHPNRGLPASRNVGFDLSSGDWLAFIDSDDYWAPDKLE